MTHSFHTSRSLPQTTSYPLEYSRDIVESFVQKYARATIYIAKRCGMSPRDFKWSLIKLFRFNNGRWNSVRDTVKYVQRWQLWEEAGRYDFTAFQKYLTCVKTLAEDNLMDNGFSDGKY